MSRPGRPLVWTARAAGLVAASAWAPAALADTLGGGSEPTINLARVLGGLVFCLLLAGAAAVVLRRRQAGLAPVSLPAALPFRWAGLFGPPPSGRLKVVERLRLGPQLEVCLLSFDGREVLVAATATGGFVIEPPPARPPEASA